MLLPFLYRRFVVVGLLFTLVMTILIGPLGGAPVHADAVTDTVTVKTHPNSVAVNLVTNKIYVTNGASDYVTVIDGADNSTTDVKVGDVPIAVAVNPVTNKVYVANNFDKSVTVIDGSSDTVAATVYAGTSPIAVAVNPVTNKIYVANQDSDDVTVIDGSNNSTVTLDLAIDDRPWAVAVNPVTNKIYVLNRHADTVKVIDGSSDTVVATMDVGSSPTAVTVNPVTNKIYIASYFGNSVTVIDGSSDTVAATVNVGTHPNAVAVNPVTNKIYVANQNSHNVMVIDGATDQVTETVATGTSPNTVAINPVTNKIYVANFNSGNVTVIDGATDLVAATVAAGTAPYVVAVNPVTNKIYVVNFSSGNVTVIDGADHSTADVAAGTGPFAVAVNPVTNKIYVTNYNSKNVTVIDGSSDTAAATVVAGSNPAAVAVNPVMNKIYVANQFSDNVTVIDGSSDTVAATVVAGTNPSAVALNPVTNKSYIANYSSDTVTVIDGASDTVAATVYAGTNPAAVAVNPVTNKIYVANENSHNVTVIDGASDTVAATVYAGTNPVAVAVNPVTNKIYVSNKGSDDVTVIDGSSDTVAATVAAGTDPEDVAVNPVTNKIYVTNVNSGNVTVINGADNSTATVTAGGFPSAVAVNVMTNTIYVANFAGGTVTVIDGATDNVVATVTVGTSPIAVAVNPETNRIYVANRADTKVTVIGDQPEAIPLTTAIAPLPGHVTSDPTPAFEFTPTSGYTPTAPPVQGVYYQTDTWQGEWQQASASGSTYSGMTAALTPGTHVLYAFATDGQEATSIITGFQSSPVPGAIAAYAFMVTNLSTNADLSGLTLSEGVLKPAFDPTTTAYMAEVSHAVASIDVTAMVADAAYAGLTIAGSPASSGVAETVPLSVGVNPIDVVVTAEAGAPTKTYTLTVTRVAADDEDCAPTLTTDPKGGVRLIVDPCQVKKITRPDGTVVETVPIDAKTLEKAFTRLEDTSHTLLTIEIDDSERAVQVVLPAAAIRMANETFTDAVTEVRLNGARYQLALQVLDLEQLAADFGVAPADLQVNVLVERADPATEEEARRLADDQGFRLVSGVVGFAITVEANGRAVTIEDFGSTYMARAIVVDGDGASDGALGDLIGVLYDPAARTFAFVPFGAGTRPDGTREVVMKVPHTSFYAILDAGEKSFADLEGHWARADVEALASKLLVFGITEDHFAPEADITRAQFATLLVRALGLALDVGEQPTAFADVPSDAWYAPAVRAAAKAGLVEGVAPGRFAPEERITRQQLAVLFARAMRFTGKVAIVTGDDPLAAFADRDAVAGWAREGVAAAVRAGFLTGVSQDRLAPSDPATRAQAAVMLMRFLRAMGLIG